MNVFDVQMDVKTRVELSESLPGIFAVEIANGKASASGRLSKLLHFCAMAVAGTGSSSCSLR